MEENHVPEHYTRASWWVIALNGIFGGVIGFFLRLLQGRAGLELLDAVITFGVLGMAVAFPVVVRSHIRCEFWANAFIAGYVFFGIPLGMGVALFMMER